MDTTEASRGDTLPHLHCFPTPAGFHLMCWAVILVSCSFSVVSASKEEQ